MEASEILWHSNKRFKVINISRRNVEWYQYTVCAKTERIWSKIITNEYNWILEEKSVNHLAT